MLSGNGTALEPPIRQPLSRPKQLISSKKMTSNLQMNHRPKSLQVASNCSTSNGHWRSQSLKETTTSRQVPFCIQESKRKLNYDAARINSAFGSPENLAFRTAPQSADCQQGNQSQRAHDHVIAQLPYQRIDQIHLGQQSYGADKNKGRIVLSSTPSHQRESATATPEVAPITPANPSPGVDSGSPKVDPHHERSVSTKRTRDIPTLWMKSQKKQQRTQQRAFASTRDNPFSFFQHDPNDAEYFLDDLSRQSRETNTTVIPNEVYAGYITGTNPCQRFARQHQPWTHGHRRRRIERESSQEILRNKAHEAALYSENVAPVIQKCCYSGPRRIPLHTNQSAIVHAHSSALVGIPKASEGLKDSYAAKEMMPFWQGYSLPHEMVYDVERPDQPDQYREGRHGTDAIYRWYDADVSRVDQRAHGTLDERRIRHASEKIRGYRFAAPEVTEQGTPTEALDQYFPGFQSQQSHSFGLYSPYTSSSNAVVPREFY